MDNTFINAQIILERRLVTRIAQFCNDTWVRTKLIEKMGLAYLWNTLTWIYSAPQVSPRLSYRVHTNRLSNLDMVGNVAR